jgi:hypothetical protein
MLGNSKNFKGNESFALKCGITRRSFVGMSGAATVAFFSGRVSSGAAHQQICSGCGIEGPVAVTTSTGGACRNCGIDVRAGRRMQSGHFFQARTDIPVFTCFEPVIPFPTPEIREFSGKPCVPLSNFGSPISRARKPRRDSMFK